MAAVTPQKGQCEIGRYSPAETLVEAATSPICRTLWASLERHTTTDIGRQENRQTVATIHLDSHSRLTTILY